MPLMFSPSDRFAIYLRKSRADLELEAIGHEETLTRHKTQLLDLAARYDIPESRITIFHEIVSGSTISARPEMQRLLEDIYEKKYAAVIVMEIERLARGNTRDQGEVSEAFAYSHTKIITPLKVYDPDNEFDQEYFEFGLFMSRREYKTIRRRMNAGKEQAAREGNFISSVPPYGYSVVRESKKNRYLVENPEEANVVRMIFDWYSQRKGLYYISTHLQSMGIKTRNGNNFGKSTLIKILENRQYIGKIVWNEYPTSHIKNKRVRTRNADPIIVDGKHKPIVDEHVFNLCQDIMGSHPRVKERYELRHIFAHILVCRDCGYSIRHNHGFFVHPIPKECSCASINERDFVNMVCQKLTESISDIEFTYSEKLESSQTISTQITTITRELSRLKSMRQRLFESYEANDGTYTREEFIERKAVYNSKIAEAESTLSALKPITISPHEVEEKKSSIHTAIEMLRDPSISAKAKNDFLCSFIHKITYFRDPTTREVSIAIYLK